MMKARKYNRNILKKNIIPHLYVLENIPKIDESIIEFVSDGNAEYKEILEYVSKAFSELDIVGSLQEGDKKNFGALLKRIDVIEQGYYEDLINQSYQKTVVESIKTYVKVAEILSLQFDAVITNPPYIGNKFLPAELKTFIERNYKDYKSDVFAAFIIRIMQFCKVNGVIGMLTPYVWMFISTYEELRKKVLNESTITSLVQLEYNAFEAACVPVCSFTLKKELSHGKTGQYVRLSDFKGADIQATKVIEAVQNPNCGFRYTTNQAEYNLMPGTPIAYWTEKSIIDCFEKGKSVSCYAQPKQGMSTCDVNRFTKLWFEVSIMKTNIYDAFNKNHWVRYNKGGSFRKWYGNKEYVVYWGGNGEALLSNGALLRNRDVYFKPFLAWTKISSAGTGFREFEENYLFDGAGGSLFLNTTKITEYYLLGLLNSKVNTLILNLISPTLNFNENHIGSIPVLEVENRIIAGQIDKVVGDAISISRTDWDSFETSWDFVKHPLIRPVSTVADAFMQWKTECDARFSQLKANEEELNRIFIDIYGLQDELTPEVEDKDVTVRKADLQRDIKSLISYAVGCMFGRYSPLKDGLLYAGGDWDYTAIQQELMDAIGKNEFSSGDMVWDANFIDKDNIIPICDDEYFDDDIVGCFVKFIEAVYGKDTLEENLKFIADALGGKGQPREVIRNYFLNDFYADHCKIYQKRPIYWLFDSGKKNGFKALIYMHRYQPDTIARIRTDYVHEQQSRYRTAIADMENRIANASTSERVKLNKVLAKLKDQDEELRSYEEKIHHLADQMITIDLDDGVKVNYAKFQDVLAKIK